MTGMPAAADALFRSDSERVPRPGVRAFDVNLACVTP